MCGLVFAAGKTSLSVSDIKLFQLMLMCDTVRGDHSTGVFSYFKPYNKESFFKVRKEAMEGFDFAREEPFLDVISNRYRLPAATVDSVDYAKVLFGHNRYATKGAVNAKNAHPFTHGKITLAHNGTLIDQSLLPDSERFEVDSENIAYSIDKIGIDATVQKLHGAFALIWYNDEDKTVNLLRNKERDFHILETTAGDFYGTSEKDLLMWVLKRGKTGKVIKRSWELEPGVQYVFDVSSGGAVLKEERKHELPVFHYTFSGRTTGFAAWSEAEEEAYDDWLREREQRYNRGIPSSTKKDEGSKKANLNPFQKQRQDMTDTIRSKGVDSSIGGVLEFETFNMEPYKDNPVLGQLSGWVHSVATGEWIEVHVHQAKVSDYICGDKAYCEPVSCYTLDGIFHIIGKTFNGSYLTPPVVTNPIMNLPALLEEGSSDEELDFPDDILGLIDDDEDIIEDVLVTTTGETFTADEWDRSQHNTCAMCDHPILFEDVVDVEINNGYCFCGDCVSSAKERQAEIKTEKAEVADNPFCSACGVHHSKIVTEGRMDYSTWDRLNARCYWKNMYRKNFSTAALGSLVKRQEGFCEVCGYTHNPYVRTGNMSQDSWNKLPVSCPVKIQFKDKFTSSVVKVTQVPKLEANATGAITTVPSREGMAPCTACGQEFDECQVKGGICGSCRSRFQGTKKSEPSKVVKITALLMDGKTVTRQEWWLNNKCGSCGDMIAFQHAEDVEIKGGKPICFDCSAMMDIEEKRQ